MAQAFSATQPRTATEGSLANWSKMNGEDAFLATAQRTVVSISLDRRDRISGVEFSFSATDTRTPTSSSLHNRRRISGVEFVLEATARRAVSGFRLARSCRINSPTSGCPHRGQRRASEETLSLPQTGQVPKKASMVGSIGYSERMTSTDWFNEEARSRRSTCAQDPGRRKPGSLYETRP